ncbi:hypothetical protein ACOMHN_056793 [Nucella lapillus]
MVLSQRGHSLIRRQQLRHSVLWPQGCKIISDMRRQPGAPQGNTIPVIKEAKPPKAGPTRRVAPPDDEEEEEEELPALLMIEGL